MKYMIISDIHGGINELNKILEFYVQEKCNKLIILGDLFNYGIDLNNKDIINRLNSIKQNIICVRGNCDNNISNILFDTPYSREIKLNNINAFLTHGHLYSKECLLSNNNDIIITGHTHIPVIEKESNKLFINPGSISKSRSGDNTFIIINENAITLRNLENKVLIEYKL